MNEGLEINVEIGLCTKEMAKENPIKDFEILIEEHKNKWSTQMYDYFKECLKEIKKKLKRLEELEKAFHALSKDDEKAKKELSKEIEKNRALEIIKKKNVFVWGFIHRKEEIKDFEQTYDYYKTHYGYFHSGYTFELLTEEEFNLLEKELGEK